MLTIDFNIDYRDTIRTSKLKLNSKFVLKIEKCCQWYLNHSFSKHMAHFDSTKISLSLLVVGKTKMRSINRETRNKDYVTDVLSFPTYSNFRKYSCFKSEIRNFQEPSLGDILICSDQALFQAKNHKISYQSEIAHLLFHGLTHLLGFDHEISHREEKIMEKEEQILIEKFFN
jgi:probable rRNA maturation factor